MASTDASQRLAIRYEVPQFRDLSVLHSPLSKHRLW
jgi:hypothetical protein